MLDPKLRLGLSVRRRRGRRAPRRWGGQGGTVLKVYTVCSRSHYAQTDRTGVKDDLCSSVRTPTTVGLRSRHLLSATASRPPWPSSTAWWGPKWDRRSWPPPRGTDAHGGLVGPNDPYGVGDTRKAPGHAVTGDPERRSRPLRRLLPAGGDPTGQGGRTWISVVGSSPPRAPAGLAPHWRHCRRP